MSAPDIRPEPLAIFHPGKSPLLRFFATAKEFDILSFAKKPEASGRIPGALTYKNTDPSLVMLSLSKHG